MKTQTYLDFKNFVKRDCVNKITPECKKAHPEQRWINANGMSDYHYYEGDSAHAIYSAWYMFKHNLTAEEIETYLNKDFDATYKHFYSHGFYAFCNILKPDAKGSEFTRYDGSTYTKFENSQYELRAKGEGYGGAYYGDNTRNAWKKVVMEIYNYWNDKRNEEIEKFNLAK